MTNELARARAWNEANPDRVRATRAKYRAPRSRIPSGRLQRGIARAGYGAKTEESHEWSRRASRQPTSDKLPQLNAPIQPAAPPPTPVAIDTELTGSAVGERLWQARNKGVTHYDIVREGDDWKLWRVDGTGLTWGQINAYVDTCTSGIETLSLLVRQASFDFKESGRVAQEYVDEFIEALVIGIQSQKQQQQARARLIRSRDEQ